MCVLVQKTTERNTNSFPMTGRHGSRINTDPFPKQEQTAQTSCLVWGHAPSGIVLAFNSPIQTA